MTQEKNFFVFTRFVADQLLKRGHVLLRMRPAKEDVQKTIFIFKNTPSIKGDVEEITKLNQN